MQLTLLFNPHQKALSSSPSAIRVVSSASGSWYFSQQCWFQLVIDPDWHFAWCTLHMRLHRWCLVVKNPPFNAGDTINEGSISGAGRSPGGDGNPLKYSCLENPMDRGVYVGPQDLAFQVSVQYYSLQHQTLLSSPNTSTLSIISALTEPLHPFWLYLCALLMSCLFAFSYCS